MVKKNSYMKYPNTSLPFFVILVPEELDDILDDVSSLTVNSRGSMRCDGKRFPIRIITISITCPTRNGGLVKPRKRSIHDLSTLPFQCNTCKYEELTPFSNIN